MTSSSDRLAKTLSRPWFWGLVVFALALVIRIWGIGWGLPDDRHHWSRHPDEPVIWLYSQNIKPAEGKFTPGFYNYGTLYLTALRMATDVVNGYGGGPVQKDGSDAWQAIGRYHLAGRIISALAGAGMCWVVLLALWRRTHWVGAVFAALAVCFAPALVIHSKFQTVDILATFFLVVGLLYAMKIDIEEVPPDASKKILSQPARFAVVSGLFFGLSAGTKYTGVLGLLALAVMCIGLKKWKELGLGLATCCLAFLVSTPGMLLEADKFWKDFAYEMAHTAGGHGLVFAGTSPGWVYHLANLSVGLGTILLVIGTVGMIRACSKNHLWAIALTVFALGYYILIARAEVKFIRYTFPLIPVLALFAGWIVGQAHSHPNKKMRAVGVAGIFGLGGFLGGGAIMSLWADHALASFDDSRKAATKIFENGQQGASSSIGLVSDPWFYTPDFYPEAGAPRWVPFSQRDNQMKTFPAGSSQFKGSFLIRYLPDNPEERQDWDVRLLDLHPDFVVYSSFETEGVDRLYKQGSAPPQYQSQLDRYKSFMERLSKEYESLGIVTGLENQPNNPLTAVHDLMYVRPNIYIWKRKKDSATPSSGSSTTSGTNAAPASTQ